MNNRLLLAFALAIPVAAQISPPGAVSAPPATYSASTVGSSIGITTAATPTDTACLQGSASKGVFITKITMSGQVASNDLHSNISLVVRSSANTGGTTTALVAVANDSNNAAATASAFVYTANPAGLGTLVGTVAADQVVELGSATQPGSMYALQESWGTTRGTQPLTLRGTAQEACFNFNSVGFTHFSVRFEWYEQ